MSGISGDIKIKAGTEWLGNESRPIVFSGPCSAETEEQVLETAIRLKDASAVHIYRAGIWKPRTSQIVSKG